MWKKFKEALKKVFSNKKALSSLVTILCMLTVIYSFLYMSLITPKDEDEIQKITYNEFLDLVDKEAVDTVYYSNDNEWMTVTLWNEETKDLSDKELEEYSYKNKDKRLVQYPAYDTFRKDLLESDVTLKLETGSLTLVNVISSLVSIGIPCIWIFLIFRMLSSQTKGLDKKNLIQTSSVKFDDVIGLDEVLDDVKFIAKLLKNHDLGKEIGAQVPKGILLAGEPGTGKTLIAKAIAGEAGVPFLYVNSSSLIEMYVGLGAKRVRDLFKVARENSPCIVFFDEIDSIGIKRDGRNSHSEAEQTINALLQEMDGFTGREGVFIIAATNRPDKLDSALVRAGRFDRRININKPRDWKVRVELFKFYLNKFKVDESVDIETLAKTVSGFTGADIAALCNEASIIAMMKDKHYIDMDCLEEAIDKKVFNGNRSKEDHFKDDKRIVAWHEAGHAVAHYLLNEPISRVSIIGTISGVGGVVFGQDTDTMFRTKDYYEKRVKICYAGRASEELKFDSVTQGACSDISQATELLREYVTKLGFNDEFGLLDIDVLSQYNIVDQNAFLSLLQSMSKDLYKGTLELLKSNFGLVDALAEKLLECETLSGNEVLELLNSISKEI